MNCNDLENKLPGLAFNGPVLPADVRSHIDACAPCKKEYAAFQSTFALLDTWQAPALSPYFDQKLAARLREEVAAAPAGWFERLRSTLLYNTGAQFRPLLAGALAAVLLVCGGTFAGLSHSPGSAGSAQVSAAVGDLQILDKNDQAMQQMDQLLQDDPAVEDTVPTTPKS